MFKCNGCGACCKHVGHIEVLPSTNGVCDHLRLDNTCDIYHRRPWICRVDGIYADYFQGKMDRGLFYDMTYEACEKLRENLK